MIKTKTAANIIKYWAAFSVLALLLASGLLLYCGSRDRLIEAEVAVVLGNEVYKDGMPSPRLAARLDAAVDLYKKGHCKTIIVSGGVGKSGVDESSAMKTYLENHGVPSSSVICDPSGVNTWETAVFTAEYLKKNNKTSVIAISQALHIPRTVLALTYAGCPQVGQSSAKYWELRDVYSVLREFPALVVYWWRYA